MDVQAVAIPGKIFSLSLKYGNVVWQSNHSPRSLQVISPLKKKMVSEQKALWLQQTSLWSCTVCAGFYNAATWALIIYCITLHFSILPIVVVKSKHALRNGLVHDPTLQMLGDGGVMGGDSRANKYSCSSCVWPTFEEVEGDGGVGGGGLDLEASAA